MLPDGCGATATADPVRARGDSLDCAPGPSHTSGHLRSASGITVTTNGSDPVALPPPDLPVENPNAGIPTRISSWKRAFFAPDTPRRPRAGKRREDNPESRHSTTPIVMSAASSDTYETRETLETRATSLALGPLQAKEELDYLAPIEGNDDDPASFDLVAPVTEAELHGFSLERRSEQLFSREHLLALFAEPSILLKFTSFLSNCRPKSVQVLIYYLDALKAIKAIAYSNAIAEALEPLPGRAFTDQNPAKTINKVLEDKANRAFDLMVQEDLPAFVTQIYINLVSESISRRITGTLPPHLREACEGLAEVFCLSDPSRPDNPIVFASEEFHRTTQYGVNYAIGRNCRFLQGPKTSPYSVRRLKEACEKGREHYEVFLNYRRDGSQFMNLLMIAPLCDSRGIIRYFIGAQVDVSGLVRDCTELESLSSLVADEKRKQNRNGNGNSKSSPQPHKDEFQDLTEMFNMSELDTVRRYGGRMHSESQDDTDSITTGPTPSHRPRLLLKENSDPELDGPPSRPTQSSPSPTSGRLAGVYQHYLLLRPAPSLRILFASPSLRVPGMLQSPFLERIGGSSRVRDELEHALTEGRGVTAKIRWLNKFGDGEGRARWIHCTPLLGSNGHIGVWMVVLIDSENEGPRRRFKAAPPIMRDVGGYGSMERLRTGDDERSYGARSEYSVDLR
ncbi:MAG: hypothetical protein MMC23_003251 [Stictis urceolatum]|nr:hypothetical protein [Stictis urceolata]